MIDRATFFAGKRVFLTGHTGFKGSWLSLWLSTLGAKITGYALQPPTEPNMFSAVRADELFERSIIADVRDRESLCRAMIDADPEIVIHLAAQPIVRESYLDPVTTFETNILGTVNLLEAVRQSPEVRAVLVVTTDKVYENREWMWGYREIDPLGGDDPYSCSKTCAEFVVASYRASFFAPTGRAAAIATARTGNTIGGGDWGKDRLLPDCLNALVHDEPFAIRNPDAVRPWQHVLESLDGYLALVQALCEQGRHFEGGWNFGPHHGDIVTVRKIVEMVCARWGSVRHLALNDSGDNPPEATFLTLDATKARTRLGWKPRWDLETAIARTVAWAKAFEAGGDMRRFSIGQIEEFRHAGVENG